MTNQRCAIRKLAYTGLLLAISFHSAHAQDAMAIADGLKAAASRQSMDLSWSNVTGDASSMVIEGVTVKPTSEDDALEIGDITLTDVTETNGDFHIGSLTTEPFRKSEDGVTVDISSMVISGMNVPAEASTDPLASMMIYENVELDSMEVTIGDRTAFSMQGLGLELTSPADGKPMEFSGAAEKFTADLTLIDDPEAKQIINALGYQNISGYVEMAGSWHPGTGLLSLSQYDVSIDKGGTIGVTFEIGGYTLDVAKAFQDMSKAMAAAPDGDNSATGMAMLGLMQQLTLNSAAIRFDDDSLTGKSLDLVASRSKMKRSDVTNQAKALVPFLATSLNNPELSAQISAAVNAYLDDPKNIEVAAKPAAPVPFALIAAGAMGNPLDLTKTLGVTVEANQQ